MLLLVGVCEGIYKNIRDTSGDPFRNVMLKILNYRRDLVNLRDLPYEKVF